MILSLPGRTLDCARPRIMGILNVTPDSFSDGGQHQDVRSAAEYAFRMADEGADMIDIGGESTRPGHSPVTAEEEISRVLPVLKEILPSLSVPVSVDTMKPSVAEACLSAGADMINDVNGLRADGMMELLASSGASAVVMHMHGDPGGMHDDVMRGDAVSQVADFLRGRIEAAEEAGIPRGRLVMDPGIGFGKTPEQNMAILKDPEAFSFGLPVLMAPSRKRFLAYGFPGMDRDAATVESVKITLEMGANIVRVHDVGPVRALISRI
jgi:dihydropteroate synthase